MRLIYALLYNKEYFYLSRNYRLQRMKTGIIIQARSNSRRFPKKIFNKIGHKNILEHVIYRIKKVKFKKIIIIATTKKKPDEKIIRYAKKNNCYYFRGSEKNVLERYFLAAKKFKINNVIRISADSPFIDPKIIDRAYKIFLTNKYDYVSNIIKPSYPKGMSCEIFNFKCLETAYNARTNDFEKGHVTPFIINNPHYFKIKNFSTNTTYRNYKFAVDYKKDLIFLRKLFNRTLKFKIQNFSYKDLISLATK